MARAATSAPALRHTRSSSTWSTRPLTAAPQAQYHPRARIGSGAVPRRCQPPIWSRVAYQPDLTGHCGGGAMTTRWVWLVPSYILVTLALRSRASAPPEPAVQRCAELAHLTGIVRTAQVTGPFDLSPSSVPSREVREWSTAGTSQVSERSAETGAAAAPHRPAGGRGSSVAGRCILQTTLGPAGAACRLTPPAG